MPNIVVLDFVGGPGDERAITGAVSGMYSSGRAQQSREWLHHDAGKGSRSEHYDVLSLALLVHFIHVQRVSVLRPLFKQMSVYDSTQIVYECACMRYLGEAEPALKVLEAAIARQPDDVLLWTAKSECCVELERHGLAFEAAAVACDLDPRYRPPLLLKARLHAIRCEFQDALVSLNRVVSDRPMPSSLVCTWVWLRRLRGRPFHECVHGHDFDALLIDIDMHVHFRQIPPMASNPPLIQGCNCQ